MMTTFNLNSDLQFLLALIKAQVSSEFFLSLAEKGFHT